MANKHLAAIVSSGLLAFGGLAAGEAQAAPSELGPLSPVGQLPLTPLSQQQAVQAAKQYLSLGGGISRKGLIDQLEYDGFSTEDATYAVGNVTVDWNAQAAASARQYLSLGGGISRKGLYDQLIYDGYTPAQAQYGVSTTGL